jgi:hypothetical protein
MDEEIKVSSSMSEEEEEEEVIETKQAFGWGMREFILILVIVLNFLGFFKLLPNEIDFIEKFISWTLLGILLYHANLSQILFGETHRKIDVILILSYFGLIFKDLIAFVSTLVEEFPNSLFMSTYQFLIDNHVLFQKWLFIFSSVVIIILAFYVALKVEFKIPSMMHILHEDGGWNKNPLKFIERFLLTNLVFFGFFIIVFNLFAEWLAIAVDDPLLLLGIVFFVFMGKKLTLGTKIEKLGSMGEKFYEEFVRLFQSEKKIWFALSGILVLHILTDVANFMIPYIFNLSSALYAQDIATHTPLYELILSGLKSAPLLMDKILIIYGYAMNTIGILFLMIGPAFIWYKLYKNENFDLHPIVIFFFVSSVIYFVVDPVFSVGALEIEGLVGADIRSESILPNMPVFLLSSLAGLVIALLSMIDFIKKGVILIFTVGIETFFFYYIYFYFTSIAKSYIGLIQFFFAQQEWFFMAGFSLFFGISCLFYLGSSIAFLIDTWK